ncbi:MAG: sigma-54-dependent Fis family transcriptional regulator [Spirochaetaceae bacterium]|nr:sigma-54-dependent Fis family transcriptional regulator [Spirochaetaceae bacterium]
MEMYLQPITISTSIAMLFCMVAMVYCLVIRNRGPALRALELAFLSMAIFYAAVVYTSAETRPIGAYHRWITVASAMGTLIFFHQFFLLFNGGPIQKIQRITFLAEVFFAVGVSLVFFLDTFDAPVFFRLAGHFWDLKADTAGKGVALLLLSLNLLCLVTGIWQAFRLSGKRLIAGISAILSYLLQLTVPMVLLALYRVGELDALGFSIGLAGFATLGFFFFFVFFVTYADFRVSLSMRILTVALALGLCTAQIMTTSLHTAARNEYANKGYRMLSEYEATDRRPEEVLYIGSIRDRDEYISLEEDSESLAWGFHSPPEQDPVVLFLDKERNTELTLPYLSYRSLIHDYLLGWVSLMLLSFLILTAGLLYFMRVALLKPLNSLLFAVDQVQGGELGVQLKADGNDELGQLSKAFNSMVQSIRDARDELRQYTTSLERTILESDSMFDAAPEEQKIGDKLLIFASRSMHAAVDRVKRIAQRRQPVLITGETGTGKELIAALLHHQGHPQGAPFVPINCAAVPITLWESQIFGHVRGAFTDARSDYAGHVAEANGGTLFFDEVGEMPLEIQPKILRLLQEGKYKRLGGRDELLATCRIVFATHRDLKSMVAEGSFREDLYYRINVFEVRIPPLRERRSDIPHLIYGFLTRYSEQMDLDCPEISDEALSMLVEYNWPGNIRELENCIIRIMANLDSHRIEASDVPESMRVTGGAVSPQVPQSSNGNDSFGSAGFEEQIAIYSRRMIEAALHQCNGNKSEAARHLKISRGKLQYQMRHLGME